MLLALFSCSINRVTFSLYTTVLTAVFLVTERLTDQFYLLLLIEVTYYILIFLLFNARLRDIEYQKLNPVARIMVVAYYIIAMPIVWFAEASMQKSGFPAGVATKLCGFFAAIPKGYFMLRRGGAAYKASTAASKKENSAPSNIKTARKVKTTKAKKKVKSLTKEKLRLKRRLKESVLQQEVDRLREQLAEVQGKTP